MIKTTSFRLSKKLNHHLLTISEKVGIVEANIVRLAIIDELFDPKIDLSKVPDYTVKTDESVRKTIQLKPFVSSILEKAKNSSGRPANTLVIWALSQKLAWYQDMLESLGQLH